MRDPRRCGVPMPFPATMPVGPFVVGSPARVTVEVWTENDGAWDRAIQLRTGTVLSSEERDGHFWTRFDWNG